MEKLTEHQFHTVWTNAVGMTGYDKALFRELLRKMRKSGDVIDGPKVYTPEQISSQMLYAHCILLQLDIPLSVISKWLSLALIAMCDVLPDGNWSQIQKRSIGMKEIIRFAVDNYGLKESSNNRDSFRREAINILMNYDIIDLNPDDKSLGPNSPKTHYALKQRIVNKIISAK